ncbi:MAG: response regulator [Ignavibacteriaceae bacterium]|nr:response regulator [Ignavibacteriaceae bacterium]
MSDLINEIEALVSNKKKFRFAYWSLTVPDYKFLIRTDDRLIFEQFVKTIGFESADFEIQKEFSSRIDPDYYFLISETVKNAIKSGDHSLCFTAKLLSKQMSWIYLFNAGKVVFEDEKPVLISFTTIDITKIVLFSEESSKLKKSHEEVKKKSKEESILLNEQLHTIEKLRESVEGYEQKFFEIAANIADEFLTPALELEEIIKSDEENGTKSPHGQKITAVNALITQIKRTASKYTKFKELNPGTSHFRISKINLNSFLSSLLDFYQEKFPNCVLRFISEPDTVILYFDLKTAEKVFSELILLSIESTNNKGIITVKLDLVSGSTGEGLIEVTLTDNGTHNYSDFTDRLNQGLRFISGGSQPAESNSNRLFVVKRLLSSLGASININQNMMAGNSLAINFPSGKDHFKNYIFEDEQEELIEAETTGQEINKTAKQLVLVVEDDRYLRDYISKILSKEYFVLTAENGKVGYEISLTHKPDLIVSDIMMPVMNGYTFLSNLRDNYLLCAIPVIMLTARSSEEDRLTAYEFKADDFIAKPFNPRELLLRVEKLLENKRVLKQQLVTELLSTGNKKEEMSAEQSFLLELKGIIEKNVANPEFGVAELVKFSFYSERQLQRKIKELTGLSPAEFIRFARLTQAKNLIESKTYNTISEVAYAVGFHNPKYFSKLYREFLKEN